MSGKETPPSEKETGKRRQHVKEEPTFTLYAVTNSKDHKELRPIGFGRENIFGGYTLWNGRKDAHEDLVLLPRGLDNHLHVVLKLDELHRKVRTKEMGRKRARDDEGREQ